MRSVPPFPSKVPHLEGEPAYALLIRAIELNGTRRMYSALGLMTGFKGEALSRYDPGEVARICKTDPVAVAHATPVVGTSTASVMGQAVSADHVGVRSRRWCPACLSESLHHRVWWDLLPVTSCPFHGTLLATSCGCKGRPLQWRSNLIGSCRKGHVLSQVSCDEAHPDVLALDTYVVGRLRGEGVGGHPLQDAVPLGELLMICERLGKASLDERATIFALRKLHGLGRLHAEGFRILGDIPANAGLLLDELRAGNAGSAGGDGLNKSYGQLYRYIRELPDHPVGAALRSKMFAHADNHFPVRVGKRLREGLSPDPGITLTKAADALHIEYRRLLGLLDELGVAYRIRERGRYFQGGSYRTELTLAAFEALRLRLDGHRTLGQMAKELALPGKDVVELVNAGHLDLVSRGQRVTNWIFASGAAGGLLRALREKAGTPGHGGGGHASLPLASKACAVSIAEIVSFVLDGSVPVRAVRARGARMRRHGVSLLRIDVGALASRLALAGEADPTPGQAAKVLELSQSTLDAVLAAGLLTLRDTQGTMRVPTAEVDRFRKEWATMPELRRALGTVTFQPVIATLAAAGIGPGAKGPRPMEIVYPRDAALNACAAAAGKYVGSTERGGDGASVARELRVGTTMVRQLIEAGHIAMQDGCRFGSIAATEVARFKAKYVTTQELVSAFGVGGAKTIVGTLASSGVHPVCGPPAFQYYLYERRAAEDVLRARSPAEPVDSSLSTNDGPTLGIPEVCARLGSNPSFVGRLVQAGILATNSVPGGVRGYSVQASDVERFARTNILANELARLTGRNHRYGTGQSITALLLRNGVRTICSRPDFPGYAFDRAEALDVMHRLGLVKASTAD